VYIGIHSLVRESSLARESILSLSVVRESFLAPLLPTKDSGGIHAPLLKVETMKVKSIRDHEQVPVSMNGAQGVKMRMLIGRDDGAGNFHMRQFTVDPGGHTPHHSHDYEHEVLILSGSGLLTTDRGDRPFGPQDVIFVPANERHQFRNPGASPLEFICLIPAPQDCAR